MEKNNFLKDRKKPTETDVALAIAYYPMLVEISARQEKITFDQFVQNAKARYPKDQAIQNAIAISTGRRFEFVRIFTELNEFPDLSAWVVNKAGKNSAAYSADYDPDVVFTTRLSATVTVHNLNRAFNALLDELDLKTGADGRTRTLYSWRHFYATQDLERGVSTHALSRQLGSSTEMIDRHYSNTVRCRTLSCIVGGNANFDETPVV